MPAFKKARELGSPGLELDVHVCAPSGEGELVVAHDDTFARTAGDSRSIAELTWPEIQTVNVGAYFTAPGGRTAAGTPFWEHPPLLEEVLEEFCPGMYVDIELKTRKTRGDALPVLVAEKLAALGSRIMDSVSVSSFNPLSLVRFKERCPRIPTAVIWAADPELPFPLWYGLGRLIARCDYLKPVHRQLNRLSRFRFTVLEGRPLVPWTIDDSALGERMLGLGCAGIITNRPQLFVKRGKGQEGKGSPA
jgi:glycerophosphoryl diester phosphodiesterase